MNSKKRDLEYRCTACNPVVRHAEFPVMRGAILDMEPYFWLFAFALLLLAEAATMGLATIWFAGGSLAAFAVNLLGGNQWFQVGTFLAVSFVLLVFTRPLAVRYINRNREKTNVDRQLRSSSRLRCRIWQE